MGGGGGEGGCLGGSVDEGEEGLGCCSVGGGEDSCCGVLVAGDASGCVAGCWREDSVVGVAESSLFSVAERGECSDSLDTGGCGR